MPAHDALSQLRWSVLVIGRRMRQEATADELPATELAVLGRLLREGPQTPGQLAKGERVRPPSMTRIIESLASRGYISRTASDTDRRQQHIAVTEGGLAFAERTRSLRTSWLNAQLARLTPAEQEQLLAAVPLLVKLAELP